MPRHTLTDVVTVDSSMHSDHARHTTMNAMDAALSGTGNNFAARQHNHRSLTITVEEAEFAGTSHDGDDIRLALDHSSEEHKPNRKMK